MSAFFDFHVTLRLLEANMSEKIEKTIFIVGNSRSGTTMLGRIFNNHPKVHTFNELHYFDAIAPADKYVAGEELSGEKATAVLSKLLRNERDGMYSKNGDEIYAKDAQLILKSLDRVDYKNIFSSFINYETRLNGKTIACKQTPYYLSYLPEIIDNMENVYFIYLVRDPRAVALSQKNRWRRNSLSGSNHPIFKEVLRSWANYHPYLTSKIWASCEGKSNKYTHMANFQKIRYEDLVDKPEAILASLCAWLDVEFKPTMVEIPFVGSSIRSDQSQNTGTDKSRISAWKNSGGLSATEISTIQNVAKHKMKSLGYDIEPVRTNALNKIASTLSLCGKAFLSISLNIYRSGNPLILIKRRLNL